MYVGTALDRTDLNILTELQRSGRMTSVELASAISLSLSPCVTRVRRLENAGYISGYSGMIDLNKLGEFLTIFTKITLSKHTSSDFLRFESRIKKIDELVECHLSSGGYHYLLKFVTRGVAAYQSIIESMQEGGFGIEKCVTHVVVRSPVVKHYQPIVTLFGSPDS